jgi:hypothetical protein
MAIIGNQTNLNITPANSGITYSHSTTVSAPSGNNTIYADYQDVNFALLGGMNTDTTISNITLALGPNTINFGNGNNVVYGNLRDLTMSISGGGANDGNLYSNLMVDDTISMAGNTIVGGIGSNVVYGNMRDLSLTVGGNIASNGSISVNEFISDNFTFGGNSITLGSGNNTVYGVMRNLTLSSTGSEADDLNSLAIAGVGDVLVGDAWFPGTPQLNNFIMFGNIITVGSGNNIIYGDLQTLNLKVSGGVVSSPVTPPDPGSTIFPASDDEVDYINMALGGNIITAGSGNNTIYGSVGNLSIATTGGVVNVAQYVGEYVEFNNISMGYNHITVGNGSNTIYGDMRNFNINVEGGTGVNLSYLDPLDIEQNGLYGDLFQLGNNIIVAGNGKNTIYGTLQDITITEHDSLSAGISLASSPPAFFGIIDVQMGYNDITVGDGNNIIYGDMRDMNLLVHAGAAIGDSLYDTAATRNALFSLGDNTISAGNGNNIVYGDLHEINWSAMSGSIDGKGSFAVAGIIYSEIDLGNNTIHVGIGNDTVYGDMEQLSLSIAGGQITNGGYDTYGTISQAESLMVGNTFMMKGNELYGGDGNDVLFGSLKTLSFNAVPGTLISGVGDVGVGFTGGFVVTGNPPHPDTGNTITFGNDTIDAGNGNDTLIGDALNLVGLKTFLVAQRTSDPNINFIDWGNDVMTGGAGNDKFVESLDTHTGSMNMQGADIITDFTMGKDILAMGYVLGANGNATHDAAILNSTTTFVNFTVQGQHELAIIFHGSSADNGLAALYGTAIQNFVNADPSTSLSQVLVDVAQFIYQSSTATTLTGAGDVRDGTTHVILPATGSTLAGQVAANDAPQGALILEGHSTSQSGYASFMDMANHHALITSATAIVV